MITLHSIDLKATNDKCFGMTFVGQCRVLSKQYEECNYKCPFYKPAECGDWIRIEDRQGVNLIPPEELKFRRKK